MDSSLINSLVVVVSTVMGWCVVHHFTSFREKRAEWRRFARKLAEDVECIENFALKYHENHNRDEDLEEKIIAMLDRTGTKMDILSKHLDGEQVKNIKDFKQSITLKNFQDNNHSAYKRSSEFCKEISANATSLLEYLYGIE